MRTALKENVSLKARLQAIAALDRIQAQLDLYSRVAENPWSFLQGTLRERLEWAKAQHAVNGESREAWEWERSGAQTFEQKRDFHRGCVQGYAEMIGQLDRIQAQVNAFGDALERIAGWENEQGLVARQALRSCNRPMSFTWRSEAEHLKAEVKVDALREAVDIELGRHLCYTSEDSRKRFWQQVETRTEAGSVS